MKFEVFSELEYSVKSPSIIILNIQALETENQHLIEETLEVTPMLRTEELFSYPGQNRFLRIETGDEPSFCVKYKAIVDVKYEKLSYNELQGAHPATMDPEVIPFLFPSRYAQSDKLGKLAYDTFGNIPETHLKLKAITDWIYNNVDYMSGFTDSGTSAFDTVTERTGVCRDFAHLGIALCRALNIPARYFTGYAHQLFPQDFHACFEAYIGGKWLLYDPTKLAPLNGLVKIATGRDAADAAVATFFGSVWLMRMNVSCNALEEGFLPISNDNLINEGIYLS